MAEAIVGPLLSKLQEVALKEGRALAGVGDEIGRLRERLMWLHALLHETDLRTRSEGNQLVHVLACQMRDIAFEAEDAVDHFVLEVDLGQSWRRAARLFLSKFGTQIYSRYTLSQKIKSMNARLQDIHDNSAKYSSNYASPAVTTWRASRYIPPVRHDRDDMDSTEPNKTKKTELTELLLDMEKPAGHVIYVVGESGIGKRHLVKKVYEDKAINEKFTVRIWENFSRNRSSRSIADKIVGKLETEWKKMQAEDHNSTYLVVVHCPMSSPTLGDSIVEKFPKGAKGSKIVVATTSSPPKEHDGGIVKLGYLDKTASRTLFNKSLGLEGRRLSVYSTETRENLDETIQVATNGLPLLVILIGKLIRTMTYNKWDAVREYISNNNQDDYIKTIVSIGMDDLPNDLKSCLLYMAGFPDRSTIDAGQLVRLWIAEGFLTQDLDFEPEELGQRYLKELIFRGLVELVDKNEGNVESVTIRDQIHPFFRSEAQRTGFMETYYGQSAAVPGNARRLALHSTKLPKPDNMKVLHKLRTLLLSHDGSQSFKEAFTHLLTHSTFLRVVSLEGIDIGEELPREIRNMLHLQYLGIRCPTLTTLPNSIRKLKQLQIMDVRGTKVTTLPYSFWNMKSKPHVICDKDLGCPEGAEDRMLIITPATSSSKHT